jgi:transposase InsO family protein
LQTLKANKGSCTRAARKLGISKSTVHRWKKRSLKGGRFFINTVKRESTRPSKIRYALSNEDEKRILEVRKKYGCTSEKIKYILKLKVPHRTIHRFLKRSGLVREYPHHRRPRFQDTVHMHAKNATTTGYLQMDVKVVTPELSGLPWTCFEYAIIDIYSRWKDAVILNQHDQDGSMCALLEILPRLPFKTVFIQTDNGLEFQKRFDDMLTDMGIKHHFIHKSTPNENAVIERSFRTDEEEFYFRIEKRPEHYDELRDLYRKYLHYYNHERIHLGLGMKTPAEMVADVVSD